MNIAIAFYIMFVCVSMNHLGLIGKIEDIIGYPLPILNCPKCSSFWFTFAYMLFTTKHVIAAMAMAFLLAYLALWTELAMCVVDYYYKKIYGKIITDSAPDKTAPGTPDGDTDSTLF